MNAIIVHSGAFLTGLQTTISLTLISGTLALVFGICLAAMRVSPVSLLRSLSTTYVELFRNVPSTILFFFAAFGLPQLGVKLPYFSFAVIALTVYYTTFFCEAVRSGINSVPPGQIEAARAIGLTFPGSLRLIILPQALRSTIPPLINVFIALVKSTAIASAFGVGELIAVMKDVVAEEGQAVIWILIATALCYLLITIPAGLIADRLERQMAFVR